MTNEEFLEIRKQILEEFKTTPDNIKNKMLQAPMFASRYTNAYIREKRLLDNFEKTKLKIYKDLYHHYKFEGNYKLDTKKEIEIYVEGDEKYQEIYGKCQEQELRVNFFKDTIVAFRNLSYTYNTYVEYKKLKEGGC